MGDDMTEERALDDLLAGMKDAEENPVSPATHIGKATGISIGLVILLVAGLIYLESRFDNIEDNQAVLMLQIQLYEGDKFTRSEMIAYLDVLRAKNPDMTVPELRQAVGRRLLGKGIGQP